MKKIITYLILLFTDLKRLAVLINQEGMTPRQARCRGVEGSVG